MFSMKKAVILVFALLIAACAKEDSPSGGLEGGHWETACSAWSCRR